MKVMNLLALLFFISFSRGAEIEFLEPNGMPIMEKISGLSNGILCIMNGIESVLQAFRSSKSSLLKGFIEKDGFNMFVGKTTILMSKGVPSSKLDTYLGIFKRITKFPDQYAPLVNDFVSNIQFVDGDAWGSYDFLFNAKGAPPETASYATCLGTLNPKSDTYDFFTVSNTVNFKLAPNIMVMEDSLSAAGGIYAHRKERYEAVPKTISKEEIKLLLKFFQGVSFRALGFLFGMTFPPIK